MFALFYESGMFGTDYSLRMGNEDQIRDQLAYINDWLCLVSTGQAMGPEEDQPELNKLNYFLTTEADRKTIEAFKIKISTGSLGCVMCAEEKDEIIKMKKYLLDTMKINEYEKAKISKLMDQIVASFEDDELYTELFEKISNRQYIKSGISCDDY